MERVAVGDLWQFRFPGNVIFSPGGRKVAFTVKKPREKENDYASQIWIYESKTGKPWPLTAGPHDGPLAWLDEKTIVFARQVSPEKKEGTGLFRIRVDGGEAQLLTELPLEIKSMQAGGPGELILLAQKKMEKKEEPEEVEVIEELPFWNNGQGFIRGQRDHLYRYFLDLDKLEPLTSGPYQIKDFDVQENQILLVRQNFAEKMAVTGAVCLYDLHQGRIIQETPDDLIIDQVRFLDRERGIFAATDMEAMGLGTNRELYTFDLLTGDRKCVTAMDKSIGFRLGSDVRLQGGQEFLVREGALYFLTTEESGVRLWKWEEDHLEKLIHFPGGISCFDYYGDACCYVALRGTDLPELYWRQGEEEEKVSSFNQDYQEQKIIQKPEPFPVTTADGQDLEAWIIKPVDFNPAEKYPLLLEIHGGPKTAYGPVFFHEMQVLAAAGYAVVFSNPRGSDGRGNKFADIRGAYGQQDYKDLMEVVDAALDRFPWLNEERLGVAGGSYGGFMTSWIVGQTRRFKAAVSQRGIGSWVSMYGTTDIGFFFVPDQLGADPWLDNEGLWKKSPLAYAPRIKTPTLFIHAEEDYRCWLVESLQMFTALKKGGTPTRLCIFRGENHELSRSGKPKSRLRRLEEIRGWLEQYL